MTPLVPAVTILWTVQGALSDLNHFYCIIPCSMVLEQNKIVCVLCKSLRNQISILLTLFSKNLHGFAYDDKKPNIVCKVSCNNLQKN